VRVKAAGRQPSAGSGRGFCNGGNAARSATAITALWKGLEVTALDGTTMELARNDELSCEFGSSSEGGRPLLRVAAHVRTATRRWIGAEIGSYHDGENDLADRLEWSFRPGMLNLADRGFFSMDRLIPFTAVLGLIRARVTAGACCPRCGHHPASSKDQLSDLNAAIIALPRHRPGRQRTSGRTAAERRAGHTEEVTCTISITESNLPEWEASPET
jgi:hypothetical protein